MATGLTAGILEGLQDHVLRVASMSQPAGTYCALFVGDPLSAGVEVTGTGYARESTTFGAAATAGEVITSQNSAEIDFGTTGAAWGTVTHFAVYSAISGGTLLATGLLSTAREIASGDMVKFNAGDCKVRTTRV